MQITSEQIRAARALLRWEQRDLSEASKVSLPSIKRLEAISGPLAAQSRTVDALIGAFEAAGVEFIAENGSAGGGVMLRRRRSGPTSIAAEDLNASNDE
jgi:transcriptional regulator with XRE-family HTH domain